MTSASSWMPLTHDMGLIGFHLIMFYRQDPRPPHADGALHPAAAPVADICEPHPRHHPLLAELRLQALPQGARRPAARGSGSVAASRLIFNGAEPISVELCEEFLTRLAPARLPRNSMYPVYGLAEASLAVSFPASRRADADDHAQPSPPRCGQPGGAHRRGLARCGAARVGGPRDSVLPRAHRRR